MTRWARGGNANKKKPHDASSWEEMNQRHEKPVRSADSKPRDKHLLHATKKRKNKDGNILKHPRNLDKQGSHQQSQNGFSQAGRPKTVTKLDSKLISSAGGKSIIDLISEADIAKECKIQNERTKDLNAAVHQSMDTPELAAKKEKRSEERRLKRQMKKADNMICFHCRQPGHGVADCPAMLGDVEQGTGICFRCGSTEHDVSRCTAKVDKKFGTGEFPYAKCFICGQSGHLSRMCPDNPRGLYPEGGGCKECGSVEHRWWNCPVRKPVKGTTVTVAHQATKGGHTSADAEPAFLSRPKVKVKKNGPKVVVF